MAQLAVERWRSRPFWTYKKIVDKKIKQLYIINEWNQEENNMTECAIIAICAVCGALIGTLVSIVAALHSIADAIDRECDKLNNKHD